MTTRAPCSRLSVRLPMEGVEHLGPLGLITFAPKISRDVDPDGPEPDLDFTCSGGSGEMCLTIRLHTKKTKEAEKRAAQLARIIAPGLQVIYYLWGVL